MLSEIIFSFDHALWKNANFIYPWPQISGFHFILVFFFLMEAYDKLNFVPAKRVDQQVPWQLGRWQVKTAQWVWVTMSSATETLLACVQAQGRWSWRSDWSISWLALWLLVSILQSKKLPGNLIIEMGQSTIKFSAASIFKTTALEAVFILFLCAGQLGESRNLPTVSEMAFSLAHISVTCHRWPKAPSKAPRKGTCVSPFLCRALLGKNTQGFFCKNLLPEYGIFRICVSPRHAGAYN